LKSEFVAVLGPGLRIVKLKTGASPGLITDGKFAVTCRSATGGRTVKVVELKAVPPGVITETCPVVAPSETVALIWVSLRTVNDVAAVPLNLTAVAPVKL